jgi:uncharacterized protein with LGFP repeats
VDYLVKVDRHGLIRKTQTVSYVNIGEGASPLGFPTSDEETNGNSAVQFFEHGRINWSVGDTTGLKQSRDS